DAPGLSEEALDQAMKDAAPPPEDPDDDPGGGAPEPAEGGPGGGGGESVATPDAPYRARLLSVPGSGQTTPDGRRSASYSRRGRVVGARPPEDRLTSLHLAATVRAAAPHQSARGRTGARLELRAEDLRATVHKGREANLVLFVVDASGSMAARQRMRAVKGAVLSLLRDAYQRRDRVGLLTFRGTGAEVALPPTSSVEAAARRLTSLPTGGRTPLAAGLAQAARVLAAERLRDPRRRALLVVVTDGRATSGSDADLARAAALLTGPGLAGTATVVVDCEASVLRRRLAGRL